MTKALFKLAVTEDSPEGDITTQAVFGNTKKSMQARFIAKQNLVVSGFSIVKPLLKEHFPALKLKQFKNDGTTVKKGAVLGTISGPIQDLLSAERVCLNFVQRMSGIATLTAHCVKLAKSSGAVILDTRKTTPGLRVEEKQAVLDGGGANHRMNLSDQYLIKDNHIDAAGSIAKVLELVMQHREQSKPRKRIEIEVRNFREFTEAMSCWPDIILLDNMSVDAIKKIVQLRNKIDPHKKTLLEISGGVTLSNLKKYLKLGVDRISMGALTHSAPAVDISLKIGKHI